MTLDLRGWIDSNEVSSVCASCRVLEKQVLSVEDSDYMAMMTGNNTYTYTESRLSCKSSVPVAPLTGFLILVTLH